MKNHINKLSQSEKALITGGRSLSEILSLSTSHSFYINDNCQYNCKRHACASGCQLGCSIGCVSISSKDGVRY